MFNAANRLTDLDSVTDGILVFQNDIKTGDHVTDQVLRAETYGEAGQPGNGGNRRDVYSKLLRGRENRERPNYLTACAVNDDGKRACLLFSRLGGTGWRRGWLDNQFGD